jgi:hypothetical protein
MARLQLWNISASFTRPNDTNAYSIGDLVANSTTAGSVVPMSFQVGGDNMPGQFRLVRVRLQKSGTTNTNANFRCHFYGASPTVANGDNGAWSTDTSARYFGSIDVATMKAFTDGCCDVGAASAGSEFLIRLASGSTYYSVLEARATYTPAANEVFTLTVEHLEEWG